MMIDDELSERGIALAAAYALQEKGITVAQTETVLYVENDVLLRKDPDQPPVFVKQLVGRNPNLTEHLLQRKTFKIKNRF
ncbi:hypothetical protein F951_02754 [Acinetobacter soli CIP 110264]|uniref:hypothetical protein n=1 Tax=Acinetobacter soli TaxID=487316 RepID=UPI0002D12A7E|nr:hypothetical protein [Acinetobacter soli]ENV56241.1 hypothetical protein F951_02754 [Acinetobacter soli CIP 110264]